MKSLSPLTIGLLAVVLSVTLNGCMETLEVIGAIAEAASEGDDYEPEEEECSPTPSWCRKSRPREASLGIRVSSPLPSTVTVYRGDFEHGRVAWSGPPSGKSFSVRLPLGTYSATAVYARGKKTVVAVDGDYLDYSATETCDGTCYEAVDGSVDLELED